MTFLPTRAVAGLTALSLAATAAAPLGAQSAPIGGIGLQYCANVTGPQNAPNLAQAVDWAMGYLAGRIDAGQIPTTSGLLTDDPLDVATAIVGWCGTRPDDTILEALRARGADIFAMHPAPHAPLAEDLAEGSRFDAPPGPVRPMPRPPLPDGAAVAVDSP